MDPVKVGLVECGFGGRYLHAPLRAVAPECELLGVVTTSAERNRRWDSDSLTVRPEVDR